MNFWYSILTALNNLRVNKLRSALTMLGVIIGVSAVIVMVAIVQGASARITSEFQRLGSSLIIIFYEPDFKDRKATTRRLQGMTMDDVRAIEARGDLIKGFSAELPIGQGNTAKNADRETTVNPNGSNRIGNLVLSAF
jgi:putative ABC transport system permease protein